MQNGDGELNNFFESFSEIDLGSDISGDLSGQEQWITDNFIVSKQWYPPKTTILTQVVSAKNRFESVLRAHNAVHLNELILLKVN